MAVVTVEVTSRRVVVEVTDAGGAVVEVTLPTTPATIDVPLFVPAVSVDSQALVTVIDLAMLP